jgi:hypothetical protein
MKTHNISVIPMYGTLLGLERHGSIIEWDDDVDVFVEKNQWDFIKNNRILFEQDDIMVTPAFGHNTLMKFYYKTNPLIKGKNWSWPFIDLFYYEIKGDKLITPFFTIKNMFNRSWFFPLQMKLLDGVVYNMPNNPKEILDCLYAGWKDTCISSDYNHRLEKHIFPWNIYKMKTEQLKYSTDLIFNNIYIINLKTRPDILQSYLNEVKKLNLDATILNATDYQDPEFMQFYDSMSYPKMSAYEMVRYMSHVKLWKKLESAGTEFAIIFEDNISIPENITKNDILNYVKKSTGFNILFLGHTTKFYSPKVKPGSSSCLHAYVISLVGMRLLLQTKMNKNIPIDHVVKNMCKTNLCFLTNSTTNENGGLIDQKS